MDRNIFLFMCLVLLFAVPYNAQSANLFIPEFELITHYTNDGIPLLGTIGELAMGIDGGNKFGAEILLGLASSNIENDLQNGNTQINLISTSITVKELFSSPINATYFIGEHDMLGSGDAFPKRFGTSKINSNYLSFIYFADSTLYESIYTVNGTGVHLNYFNENISVSTYAYQDLNIASGVFSADARFMLNHKALKIEAFAGGTWVTTPLGVYRGGLLFYYQPGFYSSGILAQVGIPYWDPANPDIDYSHFFVLFEPRMRIGFVRITSTFFVHPGYYKNQKTNEEGDIDINLNLLFGDFESFSTAGGLDSTILIQPENSDSIFSAKVSPYVDLLEAGAVWTIRGTFKVFPFDTTDMFEAFFGVKTEF